METHWEKLMSGGIVVSETPEGLMINACKYFDWCDKHPILTSKVITTGKTAGSFAKQEDIRPYTVKGLCLHCGIDEDYLRDIRASKDKSSLWYIVVTRLLAVVFTQNLEHAMLGIFSPSLTTKVLALEREEVSSSAVRVEIVNTDPGTGFKIPELSETENQVLEKLELEYQKFEKDKSEN